MTVLISTDGSGTSKGPGGYAAVLRCGEQYREISGAVPEATNNSMELMAVVEALKALRRPSDVEITTDSEYVGTGAVRGLPNWKKYSWTKFDGSPVKNLALWQEYDRVSAPHNIRWVHVKGHTGHPDNERCDVLSGEARATLLPPKEAATKRAKKIMSLKGVTRDRLRDYILGLTDTELDLLKGALEDAGRISHTADMLRRGYSV